MGTKKKDYKSKTPGDMLSVYEHFHKGSQFGHFSFSEAREPKEDEKEDIPVSPVDAFAGASTAKDVEEEGLREALKQKAEQRRKAVTAAELEEAGKVRLEGLKGAFGKDDVFIVGDTAFTIPPSQISIRKSNINWSWKPLRTKHSIRAKSGHGTIQVSFSVYFVGKNEIDNVLRRVIGQFKAVPFVFIENSFVRESIIPGSTETMAAALLNLHIRTLPGAPDTLVVDFDLLWFNYKPYSNNFWFRRDWKTAKEESPKSQKMQNEGGTAVAANTALSNPFLFAAPQYDLQETITSVIKLRSSEPGTGLVPTIPVVYPSNSEPYKEYVNKAVRPLSRYDADSNKLKFTWKIYRRFPVPTDLEIRRVGKESKPLDYIDVVEHLDKHNNLYPNRVTGPKGRITSPYGWREVPSFKEGKQHHNGIDVGVGIGTRVNAIYDGVVDAVGGGAEKFMDSDEAWKLPVSRWGNVLRKAMEGEGDQTSVLAWGARQAGLTSKPTTGRAGEMWSKEKVPVTDMDGFPRGPAGGYGRKVRIRHENPPGWSFYAHLQNVTVRKGDPVTSDKQIASSGNSAKIKWDRDKKSFSYRSTGPHLHFEWRTRPKGGKAGTEDPSKNLTDPSANYVVGDARPEPEKVSDIKEEKLTPQAVELEVLKVKKKTASVKTEKEWVEILAEMGWYPYIEDDSRIVDKEERKRWTDTKGIFWREVYVDVSDYGIVPVHVSGTMHNDFTPLPISGHAYPTLQYLGASDGTIAISMQVQGKIGIGWLQFMNNSCEEMARKFRHVKKAGIIKLENNILKLLGIKEGIVEDIEVSTIEGHPDLFNVNLLLNEFAVQEEKLEQEFYMPLKLKEEIIRILLRDYIGFKLAKYKKRAERLDVLSGNAFFDKFVESGVYPISDPRSNEYVAVDADPYINKAKTSHKDKDWLNDYVDEIIQSLNKANKGLPPSHWELPWSGTIKSRNLLGAENKLLGYDTSYLDSAFDRSIGKIARRQLAGKSLDPAPNARIWAEYFQRKLTAYHAGRANAARLQDPLGAFAGARAEVTERVTEEDIQMWRSKVKAIFNALNVPQETSELQVLAAIPFGTEYVYKNVYDNILNELVGTLGEIAAEIYDGKYILDKDVFGDLYEKIENSQEQRGNPAYQDLSLPPHPATKTNLDTGPDFYFYNDSIEGGRTISPKDALALIKPKLDTTYESFESMLGGEHGMLEDLAKWDGAPGAGIKFHSSHERKLNTKWLGLTEDEGKQTVKFGPDGKADEEIPTEQGYTKSDGETLATVSSDLSSRNLLSMRRAFPTFKLYFIQDDMGDKYLSWRSFDDLYSYASVSELTVVQSRKIPADFAMVTLTNISGVLDNRGIYKKGKVEGSKDKTRAVVRNLDPMLRDTKYENPFASLILREGIIVQIRAGYSNDPGKLETLITGPIVALEYSQGGDSITIAIQSYGAELTGPVGHFGQFESTMDLLSHVICSDNLPHFGRWQPRAEYNPEEIRSRLQAEGIPIWAPFSRLIRNIKVDLLKKHTFLNHPADDNIFLPKEDEGTLAMIWKGATGKGKDFEYWTTASMTPWDIFKEMELRHPGWIAAPVPFANRYTMFFGPPSQYYWSKPASMKELWDIHQAKMAQEVGSSATWLASTTYTKNTQGAYEKRLSEITRRHGRFVPFRKYHLLSSEHNIIANQLKCTEEGTYNAVKVAYGIRMKGQNEAADYLQDLERITRNPSSADAIPSAWWSAADAEIVKADDNISEENLRYSYELYRQCKGGIFGSSMPLRYGTSLLMRYLKDIYKGQIVVLGNPSIRPYHIAYIYDAYADMYGPVEVEQVVHSFNHETGFITSITPDLVINANEWVSLGAIDALWEVMSWEMAAYGAGGVGAATLIGGAVAGLTGGLIGLGVGGLGIGLALLGGLKLIEYAQGRQPIIITPLIHRGRPLVAGLEGYKTDSIYANLKGGWEKFWQGVGEGWDNFWKLSWSDEVWRPEAKKLFE